MGSTCKDPLCGMGVPPETSTAPSDYKGQTCYFCYSACKERFDQQPEKYVRTGGLTHHH